MTTASHLLATARREARSRAACCRVKPPTPVRSCAAIAGWHHALRYCALHFRLPPDKRYTANV
jgi:hypothetical protein